MVFQVIDSQFSESYLRGNTVLLLVGFLLSLIVNLFFSVDYLIKYIQFMIFSFTVLLTVVIYKLQTDSQIQNFIDEQDKETTLKEDIINLYDLTVVNIVSVLVIGVLLLFVISLSSIASIVGNFSISLSILTLTFFIFFNGLYSLLSSYTIIYSVR